jgi:hypothetical protein
LHTVASGQGVPFSTGAVVQPLAGLQPSVVQTFPSSQVSGVPAVHVPAWQLSVPLQALASAHDEPFGSGVFPHPEIEPHASAVQGLPSLQSSGVPGLQTPLWQVSVPLQTVLSSHDVPLGNGLVEQPKTGSQLSVVQGLPSLQVSGGPAVQVAAWQVSVPLQRLPSLHEEPLGSAGFWHPETGSQLSVVQELPSLQVSGVPVVQVPVWQVSSPSQTFPSLHEEPLGSAGFWHPETGSQLSVVQGLPSLQASAEPAVQVPA